MDYPFLPAGFLPRPPPAGLPRASCRKLGVILLALLTGWSGAAAALEVLQIRGRIDNDQPAVEVVFDGHLRRDRGFAVYLGIHEPGQGPVAGFWEHSPLGKRLLFRNVLPGRQYLVSVAAGLHGIDGSRLEQSVRETVTVSTETVPAAASQELSYQLELPSHAVQGDRIEAEVLLRNASSQSHQSPLLLSADYPLHSADNGRLRYVGLAPRGQSLLRYPLDVSGSAGFGRIAVRFPAEADGPTDIYEIPVSPAGSPRRLHSRGRLTAGQRVEIGVNELSRLDPNSLDAALTLAPWPPLDGQRQARLMENEIAVEAVDRLAQYFAALQNNPGGAASAALALAMDTLGTDNDTWTRVHAAALALEALASLPADARAAHEDQRQTVVNTLLEIAELARVVTNEANADPLHATFACRAYAVYLLAREGVTIHDTVYELFRKQRRFALSGLPLVHLGLASQQTGDLRRAGRALLEGVSASREAGPLGDHGSAVRDAGQIIFLLDRHGIAEKYREPLIELLDSALTASRRLSAGERVALMRASGPLTRLVGSEWQARIRVGEFEEVVNTAGAYHLPITLATLESGLSIRNPTQFDLYWSLDAEGHDMRSPASSVPGESVAQRFVLDSDGQPIDPTQPLERGSTLRVELAIPAFDQPRTLKLIERKPGGFDWWFEAGQGFEAVGLKQVPHRQLRDRLLAHLKLPAGQPTVIGYWLEARHPGDFVMPASSLVDEQSGASVSVRETTRRLQIR